MERGSRRPLVARAALVLLLFSAVAVDATAAGKEGRSMSRRRRLLQPFRLGVPDSDYRKGIATQIATINLMNIANVLTLNPTLGVRSTAPARPGNGSGSGSGSDKGQGDDGKKEGDAGGKMEEAAEKQPKRANRDKSITATALTIRALGTLGRNFATNGLFGGAAKSSADFRAAADTKEGGGSSLSADARSIGQPGFGRTTSKSSGIVATSAQQVIYNETGDGYKVSDEPSSKGGDGVKGDGDKGSDGGDKGGPPSSPSPRTPPPPSGRARKYKVLVAASSDYSAAGDYRTVYSSGLGFGRGDYSNRGQRDYDYGQPRPIPEAARSTTRASTATFNGPQSACEAGDEAAPSSSGGSSGGEEGCGEGDSNDGVVPPDKMRGESRSRTTAVTTAPAASSRASSTNVVALGKTSARPVSPNDTFGSRPVILPVTPDRLAGADTSGLAVGRSYRSQGLPALAVSSAGGDAGVGPSGGLAGSSADVYNYATGTRSSKARSEIVAAAPAANIGLGVIGRKKT